MATINNEYDDLFDHWGRVFNVNPQLGKTAFHIETNGNPNSKNSPVGAEGGMQIMPGTARALEITNSKDIRQAIPAAMRYLREGLDATGTPEGALAYYNGGPRTLQRLLPETQKYVADARSRYPNMNVNVAENGADIRKLFAPDATVPPASVGTNPNAPVQIPPVVAVSPPAVKVDPDATEGAAIRQAFVPAAPAKTEESAPLTPAPVISEFGDLSAQPWAQGPPADMTARAPAAKIADAAIKGWQDTPSLLNPGPQAWVDRNLGVAGQTLLNPGLKLAGAIPAGINAATAGGFEAASQLIGPKGARDFLALASSAPMAMGERMSPNAAPAVPEPPGRPQFVSERLMPPSVDPITGAPVNLTPLHRINQLIAHDSAENPPALPDRGAPNQSLMTPPETAPVNRLAPPTGGPQSVGAAASREGTPPWQIEMTPKETAAYRAMAESQKLAEPQPIGRDPTVYVNGVNPTLAHIEQSANVSREDKMLAQQIPEEAKALQREHNQARIEHFDQLAGSEVDLHNAEAARSAQAERDLAATWGNKTDANPQPVMETMGQIVASPDGRRPLVRSALKSVADELAPDGKMLTDPEQLYGVRKHIDDLLSKEAARDTPLSVRAQASLLQVKSVLDNVIEQAAPGFRQYLDNFSSASRPIDTMEVLQKHKPGLVDAQNNMQLSRVQKMMSDIVKSRNADGLNPYKSIPDEMMNPSGPLFALRDDLRRVASAKELAAAGGSDTAQNAMDIVKHIGQRSAEMAVGAAAHAVAPVAGPLVAVPIMNRLMNAFSSAKTQRRAHNMLYPDPSQYRPLNPPE